MIEQIYPGNTTTSELSEDVYMDENGNYYSIEEIEYSECPSLGEILMNLFRRK